ncbi:hypothetical protein KPH14_010919 [Odynerus spinipes]|uniref:Retrovirus-related Pol polyprotein from transposon TNT 1-94-like beta-barrel domain-containing protein n=1 Tax=Odynerus spinipes TaxID=1348599 RepID=A0AAD9RE43_9HYME|nr:hypothetical protein KPH14_010919 [Odynerus spinipes]
MGLENSGTQITGDLIKVKLMQEIKDVSSEKPAEGSTAFYAKPGTSQTKPQSNVPKYYHCHKIGHYASKCRNKFRRRESHKEGTSSKTFMTTDATTEVDKNCWYLDSCASAHMTCRRDWLYDVTPVSNPKVTTANNQIAIAEAKGDTWLQIPGEKSQNSIKIEDVLYVPQLVTNILSFKENSPKGI